MGSSCKRKYNNTHKFTLNFRQIEMICTIIEMFYKEHPFHNLGNSIELLEIREIFRKVKNS